MLYWNDENSIDTILAIMRSDGVIAGSSDTVAGLLAPLTQEGFEALNSIKGRQEKPYLILIESQSDVEKLIDQSISSQIAYIMASFWPGPLTLIFKAKSALPDYMKGPGGTIAVRVPAHAGLQRLLAHCDGLFSTSANKAGQPVPATLDQINPEIVKHVHAIVGDSSDKDSDKTLPSTILDCSDGTIKVVREGAYSVEELLKKSQE